MIQWKINFFLDILQKTPILTIMNIEFSRSYISPEWQDLVDEFPEIFLDLSPSVLDIFVKHYHWKSGKPQETKDLCNLRYGFECGIGWKSIIRDFCVEIRELCEKAKAKGHTIFYKSFILKEKFGVLREQGDFYGPDSAFYHQDYNRISSGLEEKSQFVCETTGKPGILRNIGGWWVTICNEELKKKYKEFDKNEI